MPASTKLALRAFLYTLTTSFVSAAPQDLGLGGAIGSLILSQQLAGHASTTSPPAAPSSTSTTSSALLAPPSPTPSAQTNIQIGNTPQSVGDLTGTDLINKILAAVQPLCPDVNATTGKGACTGTTNGEISSVAHIASDETLGGGTLLFNVRDSGYETNDQRDGMIALFASTMNSSASGAANCASVRYRSDCGPAKREALLQGGPDVPNQDCTTGTKRICSGPDNVDIEIVENDEAIATLVCYCSLLHLCPGGSFFY